MANSLQSEELPQEYEEVDEPKIFKEKKIFKKNEVVWIKINGLYTVGFVTHIETSPLTRHIYYVCTGLVGTGFITHARTAEHVYSRKMLLFLIGE